MRYSLYQLLTLLTIALAVTSCTKPATSGEVSGIVSDADGPVAGATVRVRATDNVVQTTADGRFTLGDLARGQEVEVTAWADGYYIASTHVTPTVDNVALVLRPTHTTDHPEYAWASPIEGTSEGACGNCHPTILPQWMDNAHGQAVSNPRFFSLYNGTNLDGAEWDLPGYLKDFPGTAGNCANCHAPGAGADGYLRVNMNEVRGALTAGIHCDYCHKVGGVYLNPATESVYPNAPGVLSQRLLRPPAGDNIFLGPYDDIHDPDTYLPTMSQSAFCAPCHQFSFWGTPIYESYDEWLASPYAEHGVTCQSCHMSPTGDRIFALPEQGGLEHPPERIPSHLQPGAASADLLQDAVDLSVSAQQTPAGIQVTVTITNTRAGHHVPTDHPGRHMLLLVEVVDEEGRPLVLLEGPTVPDWGGDHAGRAGTGYAKILRDVATGEAPVVSYWKQALVASDNRIAALQSDTTTYTFQPGAGPATVHARLLFRRLFQPLAEPYGWELGEMVMEETTVQVGRNT